MEWSCNKKILMDGEELNWIEWLKKNTSRLFHSGLVWFFFILFVSPVLVSQPRYVYLSKNLKIPLRRLSQSLSDFEKTNIVCGLSSFSAIQFRYVIFLTVINVRTSELKIDYCWGIYSNIASLGTRWCMQRETSRNCGFFWSKVVYIHFVIRITASAVEQSCDGEYRIIAVSVIF